MTFSIAGRCARTGEIGYALATSSIAAGARVGFLKPALGIVLTQARTDPRLGPMGLSILRELSSSDAALDRLLAKAVAPDWRQIAILTSDGRTVYHTGPEVSPPTHGVARENVVAVGNWVSTPDVVEQMVVAFQNSTDLTLADRLIDALQAAERAGGELDPLRSAALKVAGEHGFAHIDLRADRSADPIPELADLWREYRDVMDGYVARALNPADAPATEDLEGHR